MIKLYREPTGDYLAMETDSIAYYERVGRPHMRDCIATAIKGLMTSVCSTSADVRFLKRCKRVSFDEVPLLWRSMLRITSREEVV